MNSSATATGTNSDIFMQQLRESTLPAHKALEQLPLSQLIVSPDITREQYAQYLSLMAGVIADVEANIFPLVKDIITGLEERIKLPSLAADLEILSCTLPENARPVTGSGFTFSPAFALGAMYVIEGSTLGGRVILKNIERALGYNENRGAAYFAGYGNRTGPMWKSFIEMFTTYAVAGSAREVIAGAEHTFSAISKHLSQYS